jgi:DNA-binding CsgD family transcriptional regulator
MQELPRSVLRSIVDGLSLAVCVFRDQRLLYSNGAADLLRSRLREHYRIELDILLRGHCQAALEKWSVGRGAGRSPVAALVTATHGEPFYLHAIPLRQRRDVAVTVRVVGSEMPAVTTRYGLSPREAQVVELVLHGYRNVDIATSLGISPRTIKKHLTKIFDKVGVHSRSQLQTRLA